MRSDQEKPKKSPSSYEDCLAQHALESMNKLNIEPIPDNYSLLFSYHRKENRNLVGAIDELVENRDAFSPAVLSRLYRENAAPGPYAERLDTTAERVEAAVENVLKNMTEASHSSVRRTTRLTGMRHDLVERCGQSDARDIVKGLFQELQQMSRENAELSGAIAASSQEIADVKEALLIKNKELWTDGLTGIPNRSALDAKLANAIVQAEGAFFCVIMADVDHFKSINDKLGHLQGDKVLSIIARILRHDLKEEDFVARYGGEEFAILVFDTDVSGALAVAERLRATLSSRRLCNRRTGAFFDPVTMSFGVSGYRAGDTAQAMLCRADKALYEAKGAGRNCVRCAEGNVSPAQERQAIDR